MGYGPVINGKQCPITFYHNSWACQETQRKQECASCFYYQETKEKRCSFFKLKEKK